VNRQATTATITASEGAPAPLLRWAGSKRQLIPRLAGYWSSNYERYVEPFCGSSALFYQLAPRAALLSDSNEELVTFYQVVRANPVGLWQEVARMARTRDQYNAVRKLNPITLSTHDRAVRFLFLNRNCFNGLYRTNLAGEFNVPFSEARTGTLPSLDTFLTSASALANATLRCCDFGHALRDTRSGDFVYLDPPFFVTTRRVFRHYGPRGFHEADMTRLASHLEKLDKKGVHFVLSLADSPEARSIAKVWRVKRLRVRRQIAGFADERRHAYELAITNIHVRR
jgi:DNA adenine methylase